MGEADDVAVDVGQRVFNGVAYPCLGGEVHHALRLVLCETVLHGLPVGQVDAQVGVVGVVGVTRQLRFLDGRIVIVVVVVDADDGVATVQKAKNEC